jgi:putative nucleotidyltransferase-like protein
LALLLCGTAQRRRRHQVRIEDLVQAADFDLLFQFLAGQGLMPLGADLLLATVSSYLPSDIRARLAAVMERANRRGVLLETLALQFQTDLERAGIAALPLKGPLLGRALYGNPGIRSGTDFDFLVSLEHLEAAVEVIAARGFTLKPDPFEKKGLPQLHHQLKHDAGKLPPVELHWRVHWYETRFSRDMLDRRIKTPEGTRAPPEDELASLLLFYARDGFVGLRLAADIAAWWDACGHGLKPPLLEAAIEDYPELRSALVVAATLLEGLVGVPSCSLLPSGDSLRWREHAATRLANWEGTGGRDQVAANITFVDWLVAPPKGGLEFARRALIPPRARIERMYRLAEDAAWRRFWCRLVHGPKMVLRYLIALWRIRRGRRWAPLPRSIQSTS